MFKEKNKKQFGIIPVFGLIAALFIVPIMIFSRMLVRSYYNANRPDLGCLVGHKLIGFTKDISKEELQNKLAEYDKTPQELRVVVLKELDREKKNMDSIEDTIRYKGSVELSLSEINCQQHILNLLDQIQAE